MFRSIRPQIVCLLLFATLTISGCNGCPAFRSASKQRPGAQTLDRVAVKDFRALPASSNDTDSLRMKPGHWSELQQRARANNADESIDVSVNVVDREFRPLATLGLREPISFDRTISLARGQEKLLDYQVLLPEVSYTSNDTTTSSNRTMIRVRYLPRGIGAAISEEAFPITLMPDYQFFFVSLAKSKNTYKFLEGSSAFIWPSESLTEDERISPVRLVEVVEADAPNNLPSRMFGWTSTSHLLWNDCDPTALTEKQQNAILDWLHFGGQLIVNGPEARVLSAPNSFLRSYMPLQSIEPASVDSIDWVSFDTTWTLKEPQNEGEAKMIPHFIPGDISGLNFPLIKGELVEGAEWVQDCRGLVAQRSVGNGMIRMTCFPIAERLFIHWKSYGSFINGVLLNRPPRTWLGNAGLGDLQLALPFNGYERDSTLSSRLRIFSRDLGARTLSRSDDRSPGLENSNGRTLTIDSKDTGDDTTPQLQPQMGAGQSVGVITPASALSLVAKSTLAEASGINVPRINTIIKLLSVYLVVLVPVNWIVFRIIGRLEFAWIAAPIIAVIGAVVIARAVQLDVGFTRAEKFVHAIEVPSGYSRGCSTTFGSLYTSLSSNYSARLREPQGFIVRMPNTLERRTSFSRDASLVSYKYASNRGEGMDSFPLRSNSTSFIRSEEVCEIDGHIRLDWKIQSSSSNDNAVEASLSESNDLTSENRTTSQRASIQIDSRVDFDLHDVGVIAMDRQSRFGKAWIGELLGNTRLNVELESVALSDEELKAFRRSPHTSPLWNKQWERYGLVDPSGLADVSGDKEITLRDPIMTANEGMISEILRLSTLRPTEILLFGRCDLRFDSLEIEPSSLQSQSTSLIIIHRFATSDTSVAPDKNLPSPSFAPPDDPEIEEFLN